jgi:UDP-N-acetylmuramate: L-alanyl-gamma-D-glutamyl-meso-diaminopimelate ligase
MTALAGLLHESGCHVTGSDGKLYPPTSTILKKLGLEVHQDFDASHLTPPPDLVVVGNATSRGNPEVEETLDRNLAYTSMPRLISDRFLQQRHAIVVSGTHGKTSTTSMLAWVLTHAGHDPGFLIGGLPRNFDFPFRLGSGPTFVIEGDEYDSAFFDKAPKFMHYRPNTALVGTVEFDHADIYRDLDQVKTAFRHLSNLVPRRGLLVRYADCDVTREVTDAAHSRVEGYGLSSGDWRATDLVEREQGAGFRVERCGEPFCDVALTMSGEHNVLNALAVVAAAHEQGLGPQEIADGLATFEGVRRRLECRGTADDVTVLDDFAHHPTAVHATLCAVRQRYPSARIWAVLEPRSWSLRRNVFQERLVEALAPADEIVVADVYRGQEIPDSERLDPRRLAADLAAQGHSARFLPDVEQILTVLGDSVRPGDVVTIMTNGAFGGLHDRLLRSLRSRTEAARER